MRMGRAHVWAWLAAALALLCGAGAEDDALMDRLFAKLERLERLEAEDAGAELAAALAAAAPGLPPAQAALLLADMRAATTAGAGADYADDDLDWNEAEEEYAMEDEEDEEEAGWEAEDDPALAAAPSAGPPVSFWPGEDAAELRQAALKHWLRVQRTSRCAAPAPAAVCAHLVHPQPGRIYLPHCALLHRCGAAPACCNDPQLACAAHVAGLRLLHLPFYVLEVSTGTNSEERLAFVNHTRCACLNQSAAAEAATAEASLLAGDAGAAPGADMAADDSTRRPPRPRDLLHRASAAAPTPSVPSEPSAPPVPPAHAPQRRGCECPRGWLAAAAGTARCRCECRARDCASLARGKEHFGLRERLCMKQGRCALPRCEFGLYNRASGRCPRRREPAPAPRAVAVGAASAAVSASAATAAPPL